MDLSCLPTVHVCVRPWRRLGIGAGASARVAPHPYGQPNRRSGGSPSATSQRSDARGKGPQQRFAIGPEPTITPTSRTGTSGNVGFGKGLFAGHVPRQRVQCRLTVRFAPATLPIGRDHSGHHEDCVFRSRPSRTRSPASPTARTRRGRRWGLRRCPRRRVGMVPTTPGNRSQ